MIWKYSILLRHCKPGYSRDKQLYPVPPTAWNGLACVYAQNMIDADVGSIKPCIAYKLTHCNATNTA